MNTNDNTWIDAAGAVPVIIILWVVLMLIVLVALRRGKIRRDRHKRIMQDFDRRDAYISTRLYEETEENL